MRGKKDVNERALQFFFVIIDINRRYDHENDRDSNERSVPYIF